MLNHPVYVGHFFDGRTAKSRPCLITLEPDGLLIAFTDDLGPKDTYWHREGIHPAEFNNATHTKLQFGPYPRESVEVEGRAFYEALRAAFPGAEYSSSRHAFLSRFGWRGLVIGAVVALSVVGSAYWWIIPGFADLMAQQMPRPAEHQLGRQMSETEMFGKTNPARTAAMQGFIRNLRLDPSIPIESRVVDSKVVNAYASLGGYLTFHSALLDSLQRPEQLAGLVAHEYAHIVHRHSLRALYRASANYIVLGALFGDATGTSAVLMQSAESLGSLKFSRDQEAQADATAHQLLAQRNLSAEGMAELFELLKHESEGANIPEWLSTHPDLDARIAAARGPAPIAERTVAVNADSLAFYFNQLKATTTPIDSTHTEGAH